MHGSTSANAAHLLNHSEKFPHKEQIDLRDLLPVRKGFPNEDDPLPAGTDRYVGSEGIMVWTGLPEVSSGSIISHLATKKRVGNEGVVRETRAVIGTSRGRTFILERQVPLLHLAARQAKAAKATTLELGTTRYKGHRGIMVLIETAVKEYELRPGIGRKPERVGGEQIVRETRPVLCVKRIHGIDHTMSKMRRFILERQCPLLQEAEKQIEEARKAEAKARQEGFMSALQFGIAVGLDKFKLRKGQRKRGNVRIRIAAKAMVLHGTGLLPNNRKPKHRWLEAKTIGGDDRLFIHRSFVRPVKRALQRREKDGRFLAYPDRVLRSHPDKPGCKTWFTRSSVVARRLGFETTALDRWARGESRIPGGVKRLRRVQVGADFYYFDEDWQAIPAKPKGKRTATYRLQVPIRPTKLGIKFPTWKVAELCGVSVPDVGNWTRKLSPTPGGLPLDAEPGKVGGRKVREFDGAQVIPIVRELGRPVPAEFDRIYPIKAEQQPRKAISGGSGAAPAVPKKAPAGRFSSKDLAELWSVSESATASALTRARQADPSQKWAQEVENPGPREPRWLYIADAAPVVEIGQRLRRKLANRLPDNP
jgi:hypothetical protein